MPESFQPNYSGEDPEKKSRSDKAPLKGIVLAGGLSSRLGHDKAQIRLDGYEGLDLLTKTAKLVKEVVGNATVVGRKAEDFPSILDLIPGRGPVGGIASAMSAYKGSAILVTSCDLPFMDKSTLERLIKAREKAPLGSLMTAYRQKDTGHKEALVAIYEAACFPYFLESAKEGKLKVSLVVPEELQHCIYYESEHSMPFFNINYPADLEVVRRMLIYINTASV